MSQNSLSESAIFRAAAQLAPNDRPEYLDRACGENLPLREEVESLLLAHDPQGSFLEAPAPAVTIDRPITEGPDTIIGPYKLMEQIGEGGFGLVFVAEQHAPVRRKVALKVIKPGMDTREVVARFEAERQALAMMEHPHIAKVLDAGTTASGRPYFVMELVRGVPITEYCDANQLSPRERLPLFITVCQAVQHAHQKGIIHRDLKPSNILVAPHDGVPVVKVIDFGVAKALGQQLTEKTVYTRFAQMVGTPLYMSPEQAEFNALDVDTRSDVYSLGVLLYELITGTTPFDKQRLQRAAFDEIRRIIREEEPPRPSTRISTLGVTLSDVSAKRKTDPARLSSIVRGELDWIVMKALDKDRTRRYETANGLARDVQRYLADEPVEACPPSAAYRLRKVLRRNRGPLAAITAVLAVLLAGIVGTTSQAIRATAEQKKALASAEAADKSASAEAELRKRSEEQTQTTTAQLYHSLINEVVALRSARAPGYRQIAWERLSQARQLNTAEVNMDSLRQEAVRCLGDYVGEGPFLIENLPQRICCLTMDSDATLIAIGMTDGTVSIRDATLGAEIARLSTGGRSNLNPSLLRKSSPTFPLCFAADDETIYAAPESGKVAAWKRGPRGEWKSSEVTVKGYAIQLSPCADGGIIAVNRASNFEISLDRIADHVVSSSRFRAPGIFREVAYCGRTGKMIATHSARQNEPGCVLWDTTSGDAHGTPAEFSETGALEYSQDGSRLLSISQPRLAICDAENLKPVSSLREVTLLGAAFSPDNHNVAYAVGQINLVRIWNATANRQVAALQHLDQPKFVKFSTDARTLVTASDNRVYVWRFSMPEKRLLLGHGALPTALAFSPDGEQLVSTAKDSTLRIWNAATGMLVKVLPLKAGGQNIAFSPDGKLLAVAGIGFLQIWDAKEWKPVEGFVVPRELYRAGAGGNLWAVAFSPDGRYLAAGKNGWYMWKVTDGQGGGPVFQRSTAKNSAREIRQICFSPDSQRMNWVEGFSSQRDEEITMHLWDVAKNEEQAPLPARLFSSVFASAFFPDSRHVVLFNEERIPEIWDVVEGVRKCELNGEAPGDPASGTYNNHLSLSRDGRWFAADSRSGRGINVWNTNTRRLLMTMAEEDSTVHCVTWNSDGKLLAVGRSDMTIAVWNVPRIRSHLATLQLDWKDD